MIKSANKKVGILTLHYTHDNYGGVLQAYSIYQFIKTLGYEPYIINYNPTLRTSFKSKIHFALKKILGFQFDVFRKHYIPNILNESNSLEDLKKLNDHLDCFVVGSDQVWRYSDNLTDLYKYFFEFIDDDKPKIAYAASFGLENWNGNEIVTQHVKKLLKRFHSVSLREESGVNICKSLMNIEGVKVLDPTLVLDSTQFDAIAKNTGLRKTLPNSYIAYFLLDDSKKNEVYFKNLATEKHLKFIKIKGTTVLSKKKFYLFNSINQWLWYIKNSEIVITDSFHCVVFSIIFKKKFICFTNERTGITRLKSLLELLGLKSRLITSLNQINVDKMFDNINYDEIEKILEEEKIKSVEFLKKSLLDSLYL